jgi:class 3 adenylate cyclase
MGQHYKIIVSFLFVLSVASVSAQKQGQVNVDSLQVELTKAKNDKQKSSILYDLGAAYQRKKSYDQAIEYYLQALRINESAGNKKNAATLASNLGVCYFNKRDFNNAATYYSRAAAIYEETDNKKAQLVVYSNIATVYNEMGNTAKAVEYYEKSMDLNDALGNQQNVATLAGNIGTVYRNQNSAKAVDYFLKALKINENLGNAKGVSINANNLGSIYFSQEDYQKAIEYYGKSQKAYEQTGNSESAARNAGNIGIAYLKIAQQASSDGEKQQALQQAIEKLEAAVSQVEGDVRQQFAQSLATAQGMAGGKTYVAAPKRTTKDAGSDDYAGVDNRSRDNSQSDLKSEYSRKQDSLRLESRNKELTLRKEMDLQQLAFEYERKQSMARTEEERQALRDEERLKREQIENDYRSLLEAASLQQRLARVELEKKEAVATAEINKQKNIKYMSFGIAAFILLIAFIMYKNYRGQKKAYKIIEEANKAILAEQQRSEALLLNILPQEVAAELKNSGKSEARLYNEVSVLFTDFVNFTQTSEKLNPQELVNELHACFSAFDTIIERNGLEKIKTIGDAYMAVCGLPESHEEHAQRTVRAALEIRDFIYERKKNEGAFEVRIGINSGQVVAGIVGVKKFAYDIWGDAVNMASRMESSGAAGKVNISLSTYEIVKDDFVCTTRGKISAKNKGEVDMYFVEYAKTNVAEDVLVNS